MCIRDSYIPVGMVMDMDGKTVRVDKVDFPNEEVSLTDITDRKNPVPVSYTHLELPLCQVEHDLRLDTIQILRNRYKRHWEPPFQE